MPSVFDSPHLPLISADLTANLIDLLRDAAPQVFSEGRVDFTKLQAALGQHLDDSPERYGMNWAGKREAFRNVQTPSRGTLRPQRAESVNWDTTENLIIEGDNLEVLKLLQKSYHAKIKLIYIDPPYNTGNEFIYPDNFHEGLDDYLRYTNQLTEANTAASTNRDTNGRYHSNWLNMMYPRLFLARNLLKEDGVIFVSIDDHEVHNLRLLMDEVFGEENFIANIVWQKRYVSNVTAKHLSDMHDHILVYARVADTIKVNLVERSESQIQDYKNPDNDPRGPWRTQDLSASKFYNAGQFEIITPAGIKVLPPPGRYWRCNYQQYSNWVEDNRIWFGVSGQGRPMLKAFLSEVQKGLTPNTWWDHASVGHNKEATLQMKELFDGESPFDTPKPARLIQQMIKLVTNGEDINHKDITNSLTDDIVLDFFAGSGTTAQAVIEQNQLDGGNRKFILVQLPEPSNNAIYPTIAHITRERVRRVIMRLQKANSTKLDLNKQQNADLGFRAFSLDSSNFKLWQTEKDRDIDSLANQLNLYADHLLPGRKNDDILYELLLKSGQPLSSRVEEFQVGGLPAFSVAEGNIIICLASHLTREALTELFAPVGRPVPRQVLCLDASFDGNDALKTNTMLDAHAAGVIFKTV